MPEILHEKSKAFNIMKTEKTRYRKIKLLISVLFYFFFNLYKIMLHLAGKKVKGRCVIIYYHNIEDCQRDKFVSQMDIVLKYTTPIRADAEIKLEDGKNYCIITFDDGYQKIMYNALDYNIRFKIPFTVFIPTKFIGCHPGWKSNGTHEEIDEYIMSTDHIKKYSSELVSFGSHSESHPIFTKITPDEACSELTRSKKILEGICGKEITMFSFPYGDFNSNLLQQALNSGYKRLFTCQPDIIKSEFNRKITGRFPVNPSDSDLEYKLKILGAYVWLDKIFAVKSIMRKRLNIIKQRILHLLIQDKTLAHN